MLFRQAKRTNSIFSVPVILIIFSLCVSLFLSACGTEPAAQESVYDVGTFVLSSVMLDGSRLEIASVCPGGGSLQLASDGGARITIDGSGCDAQWTENGGVFTLTYGNSSADGSRVGDTISLVFSGTSLEYVFAKSEIPPESSDIAINGGEERWEGRIWFENPTGEWADYEYRSLALTGTVTETITGTTTGNAIITETPDVFLTDTESSDTTEGIIRLYSDYYSETVPMISVICTRGTGNNSGAAAGGNNGTVTGGNDGEEGSIHCLSGYVMSYPVAEWGMNITLTSDTPDNIRDTLIIRNPGDYGHVYTPDVPQGQEDNSPRDVLRLSGTCRDGNGSFDYLIEMTRSIPG